MKHTVFSNALVYVFIFCIILISFSCNERSTLISVLQKSNDALIKRNDSLEKQVKLLTDKNEELSHDYRYLQFLIDGDSEKCSETTNTDSCYSKFYRVEIYSSELSFALFVNKMCYYDEECRRSLKMIEIPIIETLHLSTEAPGQIKFLEWKSKRSFTVSVDTIKILISISNDDKYTIERI